MNSKHKFVPRVSEIEIDSQPDWTPLTVDGCELPHGASERVRAMSADERAEWDNFRYQCRVDPIFLANNLMDMQLQENPHRAFFNLLPKIQPGVPFTSLTGTQKKRMILWPRGVGKALDCETPIPTPAGFRTMADIHVGDLVFDEAGRASRVTLESPVYLHRKCYEVEFSTGDTIVCDEEHLWTTTAHTDIRHVAGTGTYSPETQKTLGRRKENRPSVKTTKQILETIHYGQRNHNHAVQVADAVQYGEARLPIHPYVLGAWLGDGTASKAEITIGLQDQPELTKSLMRYEQLEYLREKEGVGTYRFGFPTTKHGVGSGFSSVRQRLQELGVLNNKHIPEIYLQGSAEQRMELLRGLMDTDGTIGTSGLCDFTVCCRQLAEGARELVASLGFKPSEIRTDQPHCTNAVNGGDCQPAHSFNFTAYTDRPVFRLSRKLKRQPVEPKLRGLQNNRMIVAVRPVPSRPVKCIAIDSPNHLYLAGRGYIPTHNTSCVRVYMMEVLLTYPQIRIGFVASSKPLGKLQNMAMREYFENPSEKMKHYFPEFCTISGRNKKTGEWEDDKTTELGTTEYFSLPCYTAKTVEHSFTMLSADSKFSSLHFDLEVIDDLVNNDNYRSASALESCFQTYLQAGPLLVPQGAQIITGTRYDGEDTYGQILSKATELAKGNINMWKFSIKDCYSKGRCTNCGHAEIFHDESVNVAEAPCTHGDCHCQKFVGDGERYCLFPEVTKPDGTPFGHTLEYLDSERAFWGDKFFFLQYMNQPLNTTDKIFTQELLGKSTLFDLNQFPKQNNLETFVCGDLAYSEGDRSDRDESVLFVFQVTLGRIWVWACKAGRWSEHDRLSNILTLVTKVRPKALFLEKNLNWQSLDTNLKNERVKYGISNINIIWTDMSNHKNAKAIRIEQIEVAMKNDRIRLYAGMEGFENLMHQLLAFPSGKHNDYSDALSQCVAAPTGYMSQSIPTPRTSLDDIRQWMGFDRPYTEERGDDGNFGGSNGPCGMN